MEKTLLFIPMYNCQKQIVRVLDQIDKNNEKYLNEILIVNNRSTDDGEKKVKDYLNRRNFKIKTTIVRNDQNYCLGGSHKVAFDYAIRNNYDYLIVLHGDDQGSFNDIIPILNNKEYQNYDCMLGSRFMKGSRLIGYSKFRTFGNRIYNIIFTIFLGKKITDLGSGLNIYSIKMLESRFYHKYPDKLTFNCYMLLATNYYKQKIKFFPITWREDDQVSNVKMFSQAMITIKLIIKYFFKRGKYLNSELRENVIKDYSYKIIK